MLMFKELTIKELKLKNRIVMPPMCMYSSDATGRVMDFHKVHYTSRAVGGAGLIIMEATAVARNGRISDHDLGIWDDSQIEGLSEVVHMIHAAGSAVGIQLGHAGRKCDSDDAETVAPSPLAFNEEYRVPHALSKDGIRQVTAAFKKASERALQAGFDTIEVHGAHGYLIHEFLSPLSNRRTDEYGGPVENRVRFLQDILAAIRTVWPVEKPIQLRLSATDYLPGGLTLEETIQIVNRVKSQVDVFHISSGGLLNAPLQTYPGYQVRLAETIKTACAVPTIAVGLITRPEQVEEILGNQRADLVALGRELLRNPYWTIGASAKSEPSDKESHVPEPYKRAWL